ncbi:hypothetical protein SESBI_50907 [Sesbania bispinosa]|nr:hypothetical protein SESBI_50907 [Sesbania bispinosa]
MISSENESIDEIKHRLLCTKLELITTRMEANAEIKKYEETVKRLYKLLKRVCQERDEARDQLQMLMRNFQSSTPAETSSTIPQLDHPKHPIVLQYNTKPSSVKSTKVSDISSMTFPNHSCDLSLASPQSNEKHSSIGLSLTRIAESSNLALPKQPNHQNGTIKAEIGASLVIDKLACGKSLPQKGRLLQTVTEAGPLLHTLLVPPLPQWKNPPCSSSSGLHTQDYISLSTTIDDKASVNPNGFIPTFLSLAFPGNSSGPSSASGSGLSVKSEPMSYVDMDSNGMHNHTITGKKRKFL